MVGGVGATGDDRLAAEAADDVARLVKLGVRSKAFARAVITIPIAFAGQLCGSRSNVSRVGYQVAEVALQTQRPGLQVSVAKGGVVGKDRQRGDLVGWRERCQILLEAIHIHDGVSGNGLGAIRENILSAGACRHAASRWMLSGTHNGSAPQL